MTDDRGSLLREWSLLRDRVVPTLLRARAEEGRARVWAVGEVADADAVAVAVAYREAADGDRNGFTAFASGRRRPSYFSRSEIRGVPGPARVGAFRRSEQGWRPEDSIARRIFLCAPSTPVDLVTLRSRSAAGVSQAADLLRPGGLLILADRDGQIPERADLRPLEGTTHLYEKRPAADRDPAGGHPEAGGDPAEERSLTLAEKLYQADLVTSHASLARSLARRFSGHGENRQDLDQVALLALVRAASRYDPGRDISFSTFATATVLGELKRHFRDKTWMMRVPRSVQDTYLAIKEARETLGHETSRSPTIQEISDRLGISDEAVLEAMEAGDNYWPESLNVGIHEGEPGREIPVVDRSYDTVLEQHDLQRLIPRLGQRERVMLHRLYFDGWTQRQVAEEIGVSQMHISRLLGRTIEKLRVWASDDFPGPGS